MNLATLRQACTAIALTLTTLTALAAASAGDFLTSSIDRRVKPGDDFFQYAHGGWFQRHPIPATESGIGIEYEVRQQLYSTLRAIHEQAAANPGAPGSATQKIGDFWRLALDEARARRLGVQPLRAELARIDAATSRDDVVALAFALQPVADTLFSLGFEPDLQDSEQVAVWAWQAGLGLPEREYYLEAKPESVRIRQAYVRYLGALLRQLGRAGGDADRAAAAVMALETDLARASRKLEDLNDPRKNYQRLAPAALTREHTPGIDWARHLQAWRLSPAFLAVGQPEFLAGVDRALAVTPLPVLKDYLRLRLLDAQAPNLGPALEALHFGFHRRTLQGQKTQRPRWQRVLDSEGSYGGAPHPIGMLVGQQYVAQHFPAVAKQRYMALTQAVVQAYAQRIQRLDWMTEATKARALEKLKAMKAKVGYPDQWVDSSSLVIGRDSHAANMLAIAQWRFEQARASYGKPVDRNQWRMTPQTYNAYYSPSNNEIVLPAAAFIVPGVRDEDLDDAVVYAYAGGSTIGHEITHGFDDSGRQFDARGNLVDWWTADDAAAFDKRAQVLVEQFNAYEPLPGMHINGKATLGENIADLGGLAIALDAFRQTEQYKSGRLVAGQTPLQRFFLGWALAWKYQQRPQLLRNRLMSDVHAPAAWRVLGPVSNFGEFHEAFGVKPGQRLWREPGHRAAVW